MTYLLTDFPHNNSLTRKANTAALFMADKASKGYLVSCSLSSVAFPSVRDNMNSLNTSEMLLSFSSMLVKSGPKAVLAC